MYCTEKNLLELYSDIAYYAKAKTVDYGLPSCNIEDLISSAYLKACNKLSRHMPTKNQEELLKSIAWSEVMDELRKRDSIQNLHERFDLRLDAARANDESEIADDDECTGDAISDHGAGADRIRYFDEVDDFDREPDWVYACREVMLHLRHKKRKMANQFKKTMSYYIVRQNLRVSWGEFCSLLKKLQIHFEPCFWAYHAWLAEKLQKRL